MAETITAPYRRLPGRTAWLRFGGSSSPACSLWLGPDHLLKIERSTSRETYKRFFYRDIQSIVVEQSSRLNSLAGANVLILFLLLLLIGFLNLMDLGGTVFFSVLALPFAIGIIVNLALGSTCEGVLVTAVGTERLSSLCRVKPSVRAVQLISDEVDKAQGVLDFAQLMSRWPQQAISPRVY